jgi:hypothetical protein
MTWNWTKTRELPEYLPPEERDCLAAYGRRSDGMVFQVNTKISKGTTQIVRNDKLRKLRETLDTFLDCACVVGKNCERHRKLAT